MITSALNGVSGAAVQPPYTQSQLEKMKKPELLSLAEQLGVEGVSDSTLKADVISAVLEAI